MNRVTISSDKLTDRGRNEKTGKDWEQSYQEAYFHEAGKPYPTSCKLPLYDNARPFPKGEYQTEQALEINEYGKLRVKSDLQLSAFTAPAGK